MSQKKEYFLTKEGLEKAKKEQEAFKKLKLSKIKNRIFKSFNPADLDPEYFAFQDEISFLSSKINELENILRHAKIVKVPPKAKQDRVTLGATVLVEVDSEIDEFKIVGTLEADPANHRISNESPIGQALLGKRVGETAVIKTPIVNYSCKVIKIKYNKV